MKRLIYEPISIVLITACCFPVYAEITTDGSLGPASELSGPNFAITTDLGQQRGSNLFHSFSKFNLANGEQANFSAGNGIQNIIARVTGGEVSSIDGVINSNSAGLWMINPAGWMFGANAKINVNGAFHVSTADSIRFNDGTHFFADPGGNSVLTVSQPVGMSFLKPQSARITVAQTLLEMPEKSTLSMLSGHVSLNDATIKAPGGQVLLGAASSAGDWTVNEQGLTSDNTSEFGRIDIINKNFSINPAEQSIDISDKNGTIGGGKIQLLANNVQLKNARLFAFTWGDKKGGDINLSATGGIDLVHSSVLSDALSGSKGDAGDIAISANNLSLTDSSTISASSQAFSEGRAGKIDLLVNKILSLSGGNTGIRSLPSGTGDGDIITISAETITMSDLALLQSATTSSGNAGDIDIRAKNIILSDGATIDSSSSVFEQIENPGKGGQLIIETSKLNVSGKDTLITSSSIKFGGQGGDVQINATQLQLTDQAEIRALSQQQANAGNIKINNQRQMLVDNAKISTQAIAADGGQISINSQDLTLTNAQLTTSVAGNTGDGGNISVNSEVLLMNTGFIQANTEAVDGRGGDVVVNAQQLVASRSFVQVGGQRLPFVPNSGINVVQAAAPKGESGQVTVSNVELNITGDLNPIKSSFSSKQKISENPCKVARGETLSSLVVAGQGGLPVNATEDVMLPVPSTALEPLDQTDSPPKNHDDIMSHDIQCQQDQQ